MSTLVVVGDGAVGTAVAVALSSLFKEVILAGPPGTVEKRSVFSVKGIHHQSADILHTSIDRIAGKGYVVAALKAYAIKDTVKYIERFSTGKILCLSNGMGLEDEWAHLSPSIQYSVLSMGFRKTSSSTVLVSDGAIYCEKGDDIALLFGQSWMRVCEVNSIKDFRWAKWFANSIINPIGALVGLENNKLIEAGLKRLIVDLSSELAQLMPNKESLIEGRNILQWLLKNSPNRCSMLQDYENGSPTEIEFLTGLREKKLQNKCPVTSVLVSLIKAGTGTRI